MQSNSGLIGLDIEPVVMEPLQVNKAPKNVPLNL